MILVQAYKKGFSYNDRILSAHMTGIPPTHLHLSPPHHLSWCTGTLSPRPRPLRHHPLAAPLLSPPSSVTDSVPV